MNEEVLPYRASFIFERLGNVTLIHSCEDDLKFYSFQVPAVSPSPSLERREKEHGTGLNVSIDNTVLQPTHTHTQVLEMKTRIRPKIRRSVGHKYAARQGLGCILAPK